MPTPRKPIKARRGPRGTYLVSFAEAPGMSFTSPIPNDEPVHHRPGPGHAAAIQWGRRNRERLLAEEAPGLHLRDFLRGFFAPGGRWVAEMRDKGHALGESYLAIRQGHVDNYLIPLLGDEDPRTVSGRVISDAIRGATRRGGQPLAPATKYKLTDTLRIVLQSLLEDKIIERSPLEGVRAYSKAPVAPRGTIPAEYLPRLFPAGHGELVKVWGSAMWAAAMLVFADSGMRPVEVGRLTWGDLYRDRSGERELWAFVFQGAKGGKMRAVGLSLRTVQGLLIWRAQSHHAAEDDYIFTLDGAAPVTGAGILKAFRRGVVDVVGLAGASWTPYWLRHTFVTRAMGALPEAMIAMLAGHSVQVDRIYQHPGVEEALAASREARERLEETRG